MISHQLAQQIVEKITPILQQNINIMDHTGCIVGSEQPSRINTIHQGAVKVLAAGEAMEIYPEDVDRFPGTQAGLNWPIVLGGQIIGVVGVSGHPSEVKDTAKLVKMVAELILERELLIEEIASRAQRLEQFAHLLLTEKAEENYPQILKTARLLRFDLGLPRFVALVEGSGLLDGTGADLGQTDLLRVHERENLSRLLDTSRLATPQDMVIAGDRQLMVLKACSVDGTPAEWEDWGRALLELLAANGPDNQVHAKIGIGSLTFSYLGLRHSFNEAEFVLKNQGAVSKVASIYQPEHLSAYLLSKPGAVLSCVAFQQLRERLTPKIELKYDMRKTIKSLLDNNLNVSNAAKGLFIHRNTLVFRLSKLKDLTGLSPDQSFDHALICRLLLAEGLEEAGNEG